MQARLPARRRFPSLAALLLPAVLVAGSCRAPGGSAESSSAPPPHEASSGPRRQVLLILLDAARADRFSCYGYSRTTTPEMDRLAAEGIVFPRHFAQGTGTRVSIPSLLYSRYFTPPLFPNDPRVPYAVPEELFSQPDPEQISLPRAFETAGFRTGAISAHLWIGEQTPFAGEFQEMRDLTQVFGDERYPYPRAEQVVDEAIGWIRRNQDRDYFLYVHMMDTHYPHYFEQDARELFGAASYDSRHFRDSGSQLVPTPQLTDRDLDYVDALYDGSLRYADRQLGRLFEFLRGAGLYDQTTIAITSDHGENLRDAPDGRPRAGKNVFTHGGPGYDHLLRIPFIVRGPGLPRPGRYDGLSESVDVAPTLLGLAAVGTPEGKSFDGVELVPLRGDPAPAKEQVVTRDMIRTATHKLLLDSPAHQVLGNAPPAPGSLRGELYDLTADPFETRDLLAAEPERIAALVERYRSVLRAPFRRAMAARGGVQPTAGFAISSRFVRTESELPRLRAPQFPAGWSLLVAEPHSALVAHQTGEPLEVRFPIPDGDYQLSFGMVGAATIEVDGQPREVVSNLNMGGYGPITVQEETFRATLRPRAGADLQLFFFGFIPAGGESRPAEDAERLEKLRALGYVQ